MKIISSVSSKRSFMTTTRGEEISIVQHTIHPRPRPFLVGPIGGGGGIQSCRLTTMTHVSNHRTVSPSVGTIPEVRREA